MKINYYYEMGKPVIEENGVRYDYFNPMNDIVFKSILRNDRNHIIIKTLVFELLGIEIENFLEKDNGFSAKGTNMKGECCDYKVSINGKAISIECNKKKSAKLIERNISHLRRMIIDDGFDVVQINIDGYDIERKGCLFYEYEMKGKNGEEFYKDLIKIIHINITKIEEKLYNKEELTELEKVCSLFLIRDRGFLGKIVKGDEGLMELKGIIENITNDNDLYEEYSKSELYAMEERREGKEEEKIEIAKKLLNNNVDIDIISSSTGLKKEDIINLK